MLFHLPLLDENNILPFLASSALYQTCNLKFVSEIMHSMETSTVFSRLYRRIFSSKLGQLLGNGVTGSLLLRIFQCNQPTWVWIMDPKWGSIVKNCFLNVAIINGNHCSLPPVDIILLSRITPLYCCIFLSSCSLALVLSISRLRHLHGWTLRFWKVKHYTVGGCTDGS